VKESYLLGLLVATGLAHAATTTTWDTDSPSEFLKGRLSGLSLTADGWLRPGPPIRFEASLAEPALWSLVSDSKGGVYAATGHSGKVYHVDANGKVELLWKADQPEVFALCTDKQGQLYAATSPNGAVFRLDHGKAVELARFGAKYIWTLAAAPDGTLYAGTGNQGKIYRINSPGHFQLYFDSGQSNITSLVLAPSGHLYAGSEPNGLLYDISGERRGVVLYDSSLPEIHAIALGPQGNIFAAGLGGSLSSRVGTAATAASGSTTAVVSATPTVVSVTEAKERGSDPNPEQSADIKMQNPKGTATSTVSAAPPASPAYVEVAGVEKSAIYEIRPDGGVDTLRSSKEENVYDLLLDRDRLWFSTDVRGRIYSTSLDRKEMLLTEGGDGDANRILKTPEGTWVGLSNPARVSFISSTRAKNPRYESTVHDTITLARWGRLTWEADGAGVVFKTRTGNSARPDATWSEWSTPIRDAADNVIPSPRGRYIQWSAEWTGDSAVQLRSVTVPFLPQNTAPAVRSINVTSVAPPSQPGKGTPASSSQSAYTITVTDTGDASAATSGTPAQTALRQPSQQIQISWQADDPDGDKLIYDISFRGDGEETWKPLRKDLTENTLTLDADALADGKYFFRVTASDRLSNDLRYAQETQFASGPVVIDNTPPLISIKPPTRAGNNVHIVFSASDGTSPLRRCEYSLDAGIWQPLEAADGITDSKQEGFDLSLPNVAAGEHVIAIRVYDTAGNAGLAKVVVSP
jgi:hypothetical protein